MEEAIQKAGRSKYGHDHDIRAEINRKTGNIALKRYREVVEETAEIENEMAQMPLSQAQRIKPDAKIGEFLIDELPPLDFGRIAAQTAKQVIMQKCVKLSVHANTANLKTALVKLLTAL